MGGRVERGYDAEGRIASLSVNAAAAVDFAYDDDGLLARAGALELVRHPGHGRVLATTLGAVRTERAYNAFGELEAETVSVAGAPLYALAYHRDALGRITERRETLAGEHLERAYRFDLAGRLASVLADGRERARYLYDDNGNRVAGHDPLGGPIAAAYDAQDRLLRYNDAAYAYTADGELRTRTDTRTGEQTRYDYDPLGNLLGVTLPDATRIEYLVDGRNRRVGKRRDGALVQGFLYRDQLNPVAELDAEGNVVARFVYADKPNVPAYLLERDATGATRAYRIVSDPLGSVRLVVDAADGTVVQRIDYDAWGNVLLDTRPGFQPFGFAGGIYDADTGLVRFGARDYDPETGRWTTKDPIRHLAGAHNLYAYVANNPTNAGDPTGLAVCLVHPQNPSVSRNNELRKSGRSVLAGFRRG